MSCSGRVIRLAGRRAMLIRQRSAEVPLQPPPFPAKPTVLALGPAYGTTRRLPLATADLMKDVLKSAGPPSSQSLLEAATITAKCLVRGHFVRTGRFPSFAELRSALHAGSTGGSGVLKDSAAAVALLQATETDAQQLALSASQIIKVIAPTKPVPSNVAIAAPALALPVTSSVLPAPTLGSSIRIQPQLLPFASLASGYGSMHALQAAGSSHMKPLALSGSIASASGFASAAHTSSEPASKAVLTLAPSASAPSAGLTAETGGLLSDTPGYSFFPLPHLGLTENLTRAQDGSGSGADASKSAPRAVSQTAIEEAAAYQLHLMMAMAVLLSLSCAMLVTRMQRQMEERLIRVEATAEYWHAQVMSQQNDAVERAMANWAAQHDVELQAASQELLFDLRSNR